MLAAVEEARGALASSRLRLGVYANAFPGVAEGHCADTEDLGMRQDLGPQRYAAAAKDWVRAGASIVGGCCGIGPEYIALLDTELRGSAKAPPSTGKDETHLGAHHGGWEAAATRAHDPGTRMGRATTAA